MQAYLYTHNSIINMQLSMLTHERIGIGFAQMEVTRNRIVETTNDTQKSVQRVEQSVSRQESLLTSLVMFIPRLVYTLSNDVPVIMNKAIEVPNRPW